MKHVILLVVVSFGLPGLNAKKQEFDWQKGTLIEATRYPRFCYTGNCREFVDGQRLVIEFGDYYLTAEHPMIRHPDLTVRGTIQFAVKKSTLWIRDDQGRVFELKLVRKELK